MKATSMKTVRLSIMTIMALLCTPALFAMNNQNEPFMRWFINNQLNQFMRERKLLDRREIISVSNLHRACHYGRYDFVSALVGDLKESGKKNDLIKKDDSGNTPREVALLSAAAFEFPEDVEKDFKDIEQLLAVETFSLNK